MDFKIIYEDKDVLVVDKPAGIVIFPEGQTKENTLIDYLIEKYPSLGDIGSPPRFGVVHRLDKDTSGILLVAKNNEALIFLQKQFSAAAKALADKKNRTLEKTLEKRYTVLVVGEIKNKEGIIETLIGRSPKDGRKQKVFLLGEPDSEGKRQAITEYKVLNRFDKYTLLEVFPKTGRKHQIRCHLSYTQHPIAGDKLYSFKNSPIPEGLTRQFLHANYLKIQLPGGEIKEFISELPEELKKVIDNIK